jgi:hypothetical protein
MDAPTVQGDPELTNLCSQILSEKYENIIEDYRRLKSDYEEVREAREKYKRLAKDQDRSPFVLLLVDGDGYNVSLQVFVLSDVSNMFGRRFVKMMDWRRHYSSTLNFLLYTRAQNDGCGAFGNSEWNIARNIETSILISLPVIGLG